MARRASSGISPALLIGIAVFVAVAFFGGRAFMGKKKESFAGTSTMDVKDFLDNGNSLRDNEYVIEGVVDEKYTRDWSPNQVVSLEIKGSGEFPDYVGVEIPPEFLKVNIERKQRYAIKVKVRQGGIPVATGINRL
ncbi:hypothetical protein [Haloferula sp. BvORR071]|uniref:hypothetical protein n=1 Tax=Haloferula sp. BvORR071 TaxID=1396141 RepID=UPI002240EF75|nr:hypothetical protein [Haloferula sp. BvORR071]